MTRKNRRSNKLKKNKIIQKNLIRNIAVILVLIVFLFVIYRFNFSSKSELTETVKINFKEFGENISLEEQELDMEVLTDADGIKYIFLPEKINGYFVQQYHITNLEENSNTNSSVETNTTNTLLENVIPETNTIEEIAGLKKYYLTSQEYEENEIKQNEDNVNKRKEENKENQKEENAVSNTINNSSNTTVQNNTANEIVKVDDKANNTVKNEVQNNTIENTSNNIINKNETIEEKDTLKENAEDINNANISDSGIMPGTRYNVYETGENGKYTLGNVLVEVEYQTITNENVRLYNQELSFKDESSEITVIGYIPAEYKLNCTKENINELESQINEYEDLKDYQMLFVYDISIQKDGNAYQPENYEWAPGVSVKIQSTDLNSLPNKDDVKLVHFADAIETIENFEIDANSVNFLAKSFSKYAVLVKKAITETTVTIDTYEEDKNYYLGKNYTDNASVKYSDDNLAKVIVNYHGNRINDYTQNTITNPEYKYNQDFDIELEKVDEFTLPNGLNGITFNLKVNLNNPSIISEGESWTLSVQLSTNYTLVKGDAYTFDGKKITAVGTYHAGEQITIPVKIRYNYSSFPVISGISIHSSSTFTIGKTNEISLSKNVTGYISADSNEKQNTIIYEKCVPIVDGEVQFELIDNPFMDRPVGTEVEISSGNKVRDILFGFNGWTYSETDNSAIKTDFNTKLQTVNLPITGKQIEIDLYANWEAANTVFVKNGGSGDKSGKTIDNAIDTFQNAILTLNSNNSNTCAVSERELNIIVVVGELNINGGTFSNDPKKGFTVTSLYQGKDYRNEALINISGNIELSKDLELEFLNIVSSKNYKYTDFSWSNNQNIKGNSYNLRIGRGMIPLNHDENTTTFCQVQGGGRNDKEFRTVIESGRYASIYADRFIIDEDHKIASSLIIGCDYDKCSNDNTNLEIYYRICSRITNGKISNINSKPLYNICIKSGRIGIDAFVNEEEKSQLSGIMVGGTEKPTTSGTYDLGNRMICVEGGNISNLVGGVMTHSSYYQNTNTYIYVKGENSDIQTLIGGAVQLENAGNRILQVTAGTIQYSICSGTNGEISRNTSEFNGKLDGNTLLYVGGNAIVGGNEESRIKPISEENKDSLYGLQYGCILGAGNGNKNVSTAGVVNSSHIIIDGNAKIANNVYGGGNFAGVQGNTRIDIYGGTIGGTVHGGSNTSGTVKGNASINITGGTINGNVTDEISITSEGNIKENEAIFAGGYGSDTAINGDASIDISNEKNVNIVGNIYGGSAMGNVNGSSTIKIDKTSKENNLAISGKIFGAGKGTESKGAVNNSNIKISIEGGTYPNLEVFGGANVSGYVDGNVLVEIGLEKNTTINKVYGGGNEAILQSYTPSTQNTDIINLGVGAIVTDSVFNGGNKQGIANNFDSEINVVGSNIKNVYGGSYESGNLKETNINISENANIENIYGAGFGATTSVTGDTKLEISKSKVTGTIYGGGNNGKTSGSTSILIKNSEIKDIYGGGLGESAFVENNTKIEISDSTINNVYGGGREANVNKNTEISLINSNIKENVYGAGEGNNATVSGSTSVKLNNSVIQENVFGGGDLGVVEGSTFVRITSSTVNGNAYAAGNGRVEENGMLALVKGSTKIIAEGNTIIGESIFGGGNASNVGKVGVSKTDTDYLENANTEVYISGATIGTSSLEGKIIGNVYGGSNRSRIYGNANIYIGQKAVEQDCQQGVIEIKGTVYGGGESVTGGENFDYDFKSVMGSINIDIDGNEYDILNEGVYTNSININGSIFGSGNASSASKNGNISIKKYGSEDNIKNGISIQRASQVTIENSVIKLSGTTDSTNVFSDTAYTLNHIVNLSVKDYTTLYLRYGANLLESFSSLKQDGSPAIVEFDDEHNKVKSGCVDNRIYMYSGENLNISKSSDSITAEAGDVIGMTFFGLYEEDTVGNIYSGVYDKKYPIGNPPSWEQRQFERTYVLGAHKTNHDITKDGFYTIYEKLTDTSNAHKEDGTLSKDNYVPISSYLDYINPEPEDQLFYRWYSGFDRKVINITTGLIASRYSTFGTKDVELDGVEAYPNSTLTLESFNISDDWINDVGLYDKNEINNVEPNETIANTHFGLGMKTGNSGWTNEASTDFLLTPGSYQEGEYDVRNEFVENTTYKGDNTYSLENMKSTVPSLEFYLYNSNTINLPDKTKIGNYKLKLKLTYTQAQNFITVDVIINISITVSNVVGENIDGYNASITPGIKYDLFTRTPTNITSKSSFSAIFELAQPHFKNSSEFGTAIYEEEKYEKLYRVIDVGYSLPLNTTITMIDKSKNAPKYYYYIVNERDMNKTTYNLDDFIAMGTANPNEKYNESEMNNEYYDSSMDYEYECFIFIVNFENAVFTNEEKNSQKITSNPEIKIELRAKEKNSEEEYKIISGIIGSQQAEGSRMQYNIYNVTSKIEPTATINSSVIYLGNKNILTVDTIFSTSIVDSTRIYNTQYFDRKLGSKITLHKINEDGTMGAQVSDSELSGLYFQVNDTEYYPKADGTTRVKMTEIVSNTSIPIIINAENSTLSPGKYIILIETFGSADGIYYGAETDLSSCQIEVTFVSNEYGLRSTINENQVIIDRETGCTLDTNGYASKDLNNLDVTLEYRYSVANPYITVSLERRKYDQEYSLEYDAKDIKLTDYLEINSEEDKEFIEVTDIWGEFKDYEERPKRSYRTEYEVLDLKEIQLVPETGNEKIRRVDLHYKLKPNLPLTGTYKLVFTLYDKTSENYQYIGEVCSYIIIK